MPKRPRKQGEAGFEPSDIRERARAALTLVEASSYGNQEDMELEAFMGLFHPALQRDRTYMRRLKAARKGAK